MAPQAREAARVTCDLLARRGRKSDQSWVNHKLLLTGAEHHSARQWRRFTTMLDTADPTGEIGGASRRRGQSRTAHLDRQQVGEGRTGEK